MRPHPTASPHVPGSATRAARPGHAPDTLERRAVRVVIAASVLAILGGVLLLLANTVMHPLATAAIIACGLFLAASARPFPYPRFLRGALSVAAVNGIVFLLHLTTGWPTLDSLGGLLTHRHHPSDITLTICFLFLVLSLSWYHLGSPRSRPWSTLPLLPVFAISLQSITAGRYGIETPHLWFTYTILPVPSAVLLGILLVGALALQPTRGFMGVITSRHVGGQLARVAFPVLLLLPFTVGWIRFKTLKSNSFDPGEAFSQFSVTNVLGFALFIWVCARFLNRVDQRRQKAIASLQETNRELQRVNRELETRITDHARAEAARHEAELQLFESRKLEAVGTLASGIAHDFNNLLTVILLSAEDALDNAPADGALRENLLEIRRSGGRAADVVRQIMAFARKAPGRRDPMDPDACIREAADMIRRMLDARIELRLDIAPGLPLIPADPTQLQQVLLNLGTNAADAMSGNGGLLTISAHPGQSDGADKIPPAHVRITVSDTGLGIDPETLKRIFDPFFTTKPPGKGTGLGLSVADGILRAHGGAIRVDSMPGRGTRFHLYFPVATDTIAD